MIRVVVVDDHMVIRTGLKQLLGTVDDMMIVGDAADGLAALEVIERERPDVVLMDLSMPILDGVAATEQISARYPECKVLVLTSFSDERRISDSFAAGADGCLLKHSDPERIIAAIRSLCDGGIPAAPEAGLELASSRPGRSVVDDLSPREVEVLNLLCDGHANKLIARRLGVSERTVKAHLTRIFHQIEVTDRTQAAMWAMRNLDLR